MDLGFTALSGLIGLILGSFYTACVYRWLHEVSLVRPARSFCPLCEHPLSWSENVPLVSWLLQRGRCRHCGGRMHWRYPAVELVSLVWAAALAAKFGFGVEWGVYMAFGGVFIVAGCIDLESFLLPDVLTIPGSLAAVAAYAFLLGPGAWDANLKASLLGLAVGGGLFLALHYAYKLLRGMDGLGLGDVKLMCLIGGLLTATALPFVILVGGLSALCAAVFWMARPGPGGGKGGKTPVPFGPFLSLAAMLWILCGPELWTWYLGVLR